MSEARLCQNAAGTSDASTSSANPLQSLASDIQAMLIGAQNGTALGGGTGSGASPEQKRATDLQTLLSDLQTATSANTQTANSNPTAPDGTAVHHHHHHHHGGGEANGAFDVAAAAPTGTQAASGHSVAADIAQAIRAYGGGSIAAAFPMLMA